MIKTPLNSVDEAILDLDGPVEPWSCHLEIRCAGTLDPRRVGESVAAAVRRHPLAHARLVPAALTDTGRSWEITDAIPPIPVEVSYCRTDSEVAEARARLQSVSPRLQEAPPFQVALVAHPDGDYLMLNVHHAVGDGMTSYRLMVSILRAYAGLDDPVPAVDPLASRDLVALVGSKSITERLQRLTELAGHIGVHRSAPARVAPSGATERPGYGFHLMALDAGDVRTLVARRTGGSTINDLLIAGLVAAIHRWNADHCAQNGRIGIMMPVNLRPAAWRNDVLGNVVSYVTVSVPRESQADLMDAVGMVVPQTARFKEASSAAALIDLLQINSKLIPRPLRSKIALLQPLTGGTIVATAVLSNLGRQNMPDLPAPAGPIKQAWFSPPGHMPMGTSVGVITVGDQLFITLRYRHTQFDSATAAAFAEAYREILLT